ncbi:uncharacterized protein LODBEIA_P56490 [Lodderomyces beijingensis]|uniref:Mediator of RNA polymerase II transcription subunit 14 n=1 Tax=Lodderomyces beijingensis TaxID=1775926 RepID=A0ABP0ZTG4_9ASCO
MDGGPNGTVEHSNPSDDGSSHINNGNGQGNNHENGQVIKQEIGEEEEEEQECQLPKIPHITENLLPLANVLKYYSQEAYKQLLTAIENLSINAQEESDVKRKKYLLDVIVSLRQDFIKVYTLVKWSNVSQDVSKFIDLLNWFRHQDFNFEQLMFQLQTLSGYGAAKLPNFDIATALEVFYHGRPTLPSRNYLKRKKISPQKVLEVLQDLNLALMTRFALMEIPSRFQYEIRDGRAYIRVANEFEVSITSASDAIIENDHVHGDDDGDESKKEKESKESKEPKDKNAGNQFYIIDFKFLFGINPGSNLIVHGDGDDGGVVTRLPPRSYAKLERIANQTLVTSGLQGLYELLHKYTISFKLFLIAKQLRELMNTTKWKNTLQINYQTGNSIIIVNYWSSNHLSQNWRSFIEIGIDRNFNLNYRWFKNGRYESQAVVNEVVQANANQDDDNDDLFDEMGCNEINIESVISAFMLEHSASLMKTVFSKFELKSSHEIIMPSPHEMIFSISPKKTTAMAINSLTGHFYFINPTPIQTRILKRINSPKPLTANLPMGNKSFVLENDVADWVIENLLQLKLETFSKEVNNYLTTTEWIHNSIIKINENEFNKLLLLSSLLRSSVDASVGFNRIQFYRRKHWPSTWFLIVMISGVTTKTYWWVARIKSIEATWVINHSQQLFSNPELSYEFFKNLGKSAFQKIINHVILEELESKQVSFKEVNGEAEAATALHEFALEIPSVKEDGFIIHDSLIEIDNNNNVYNNELLPLENSSAKLFLQIQLINQNNVNMMYLKLFGNLKNSAIKNSPELAELNIHIDEAKQTFEITKSLHLSQVINESKKDHFLNSIFDNLNKLSNLLKMFDQLKAGNVQILDTSMNNIVVRVNDDLDKLVIRLPNHASESLSISTIDVKKWEVELIIHYVNHFLHQNHSDNIVGIIKYLCDLHPVFQAIKVVQNMLVQQQDTIKLSNGLSKICFDCIFNNLNLIQFMFNLSSTVPNTKKIQKDKVLISLCFKKSKMDQQKLNANQTLIKVSMRRDLNGKNAKLNQLFEMIFKNINEMERDKNDQLVNLDGSHFFIRLNYDFLISSNLIEEMMKRITKCVIQYSVES